MRYAKSDAIEQCSSRDSFGMIASWNFYYARPGNAAAVLQQRIKASDVRQRLGLPRGRIISKIEGSEHWPDVAWQLVFTDMSGQDVDMKVRADSSEFETIRLGMRQLYRRFERPLYAPCRNDHAMPPSNPEQRLMIYGLYCEESACPAVRVELNGIQAVEFVSGGVDVPRIIVETDEIGMPSALMEKLRQMPLRVERSLCLVAATG